MSREGKLPVVDRIVAGLLSAAVVWAPIPLGSTGEWSRLALEAIAAVSSVTWALSRKRSAAAMAIPVAAASLALLQLVPLPDSILFGIAPVSAGAWKVAHLANPGAWGSISIDPAATAAGARRLLLGLGTIMVVADLARSPELRRWFFGAVAASGGVVMSLGIAFPVDARERIVLGLFDLKGPGDSTRNFWQNPLIPPIQSSGFSYLAWLPIGGQRYQTDIGAVGDGFGSYISSNAFAAGVYLTFPLILSGWMLLTRNRLPQIARWAVAIAAVCGAIWLVGPMAGSRAGCASLL